MEGTVDGNQDYLPGGQAVAAPHEEVLLGIGQRLGDGIHAEVGSVGGCLRPHYLGSGRVLLTAIPTQIVLIINELHGHCYLFLLTNYSPNCALIDHSASIRQWVVSCRFQLKIDWLIQL